MGTYFPIIESKYQIVKANFVKDVARGYKDHFPVKGKGRKNLSLEDLPSRESIRNGGAFAYFNWNTVRNWLEKQVGRPWSKVYQEACKGSPQPRHNYLSNQFRDCIHDLVETNVFMEKGKPYAIGKWGAGMIKLESYKSKNFYVNPENGLLCKAPRGVPFKRTAKDKDFVLIRQHEGSPPAFTTGPSDRWVEAYLRISGIWYLVHGYYLKERLNPFPNWVDKKGLNIFYKHQLNHRELRVNNLENAKSVVY